MFRLTAVLAASIGCALQATSALADDEVLRSARDGVALAFDAARAWAPDAELVYVENDQDVDATGAATRWGYLFSSAVLRESRAYSIEGGEIETAETLSMDFEAPAVSADWIDSRQALAAAEVKAGAKYRTEQGGRLQTMLLMRGVFHDEKPDATTWTVVYSAAGVPSLFVVVDAATGKVARTWRG
jgi:hypothetical protein